MKNVLNLWHRSRAAVRASWRSQWSGSLLQRGLTLWCDELVAMLPTALAARLGRGADIRHVRWPLVDEVDTTQPVVVVLPVDQAMVQRITLPLAATRHLHRVLRHEIDRYFPYAPEQLHFVARLVQRRGTRAEVEVVAVERERLEEQLTHCRERGWQLYSVDVADHSGTPLGVNLLPAGAEGTASRHVRLDRWLGLGALLLVLALAAGYVHRQQQQLDLMQAAVSARQAQVQHIQSLRRELEDTSGAARYLNEQLADHPPISVLLATLTSCLGEGHWVEELSVAGGGELTFSGQSAQSSALLEQIRQCPGLAQARFQGVIQTDDQTGRERYSIHARQQGLTPSTQGDDHAPTD